jgi:hypothetical protein
MPATVHRSVEIIAFNANGDGRQAYQFRKQLQELKMVVVLFSETYRKPLMRVYIQNYEICGSDRRD